MPEECEHRYPRAARPLAAVMPRPAGNDETCLSALSFAINDSLFREDPIFPLPPHSRATPLGRLWDECRHRSHWRPPDHKPLPITNRVVGIAPCGLLPIVRISLFSSCRQPYHKYGSAANSSHAAGSVLEAGLYTGDDLLYIAGRMSFLGSDVRGRRGVQSLLEKLLLCRETIPAHRS